MKREKKSGTLILPEVTAETQEACKFYQKSDLIKNYDNILSNKIARDTDNEDVLQKKYADPINKRSVKSENLKFSTNPKTSTIKQEENDDNSIMSDLRYRSSYHLHNVNDATRENEINTEKEKDGKSMLEKNMQISKDILSGKLESKVYKGSNANIIYLEKSEKDISRYKVTGSLGPMRAPSNIRVTCRFDYAQGICKDYKETGRCGFGDGCIFMHDRGDYKTGWELEAEWKKEQLEKEKLIREGRYKEINSDDEEYQIKNEDEMDLICPICEHEFVAPIVTNCGHYFCEKCAVKNYEKNPKCFVCYKKVYGIFNNASDLIGKLKERKNNLENSYTYKQEKESSKDSCCRDKCENPRECKKDKFKYELDLREDDECQKIELNDKKNAKHNHKQYDRDQAKFEFDFEDIENKKKKKNNFKIQNGWIYPTDFKNY